MDARGVTGLEIIVDWAAAAVLAVAVAFAAVRFGLAPAVAGVGALAALTGGWLALRSIGPGPIHFKLAEFQPEPLPAVEEMDELVLTEADRRDRPGSNGPEEELVLDDVLARLEDLSRVVRLFDRSAMPNPGDLKARVDRHLDRSRASEPDASQALHDALSELRRTLR